MCDIMKKTSISIMLAVLTCVACQKAVEVSPMEDTPIKEGRSITFQAKIIDTKVAVSNTGVVTWTDGDSFAIYNTDGTKFEASISGGQGTAEGTFTCPSFSGTLDVTKPAVYPYEYAGEAGKVVIPHYIAISSKIPAVMASTPAISGETVTVDFHHIMPVIQFTLKDVPAYARGLKISSATGAKVSGTYSVNAELNGTTTDSGETEQIIYFPYKTAYGADATVTIYAAIPAYTYTDLMVTVVDGDADAIFTAKKVKSTTADLKVSDYKDMPTLDVRSLVGSARDKYVKVEGVKWAKGNLRAWKSGTSGTGWQEGWNVYGEQWESVYFTKKSNTVAGFNFSLNDSDFKESETYTQWDYFGWGTIGSNSRDNNYSVTSSTVSFSICGKVYDAVQGDVAAATQITSGEERWADAGFSAEGTLCGDLAYWASKGRCRLPNATELGKLTTNNGGASRAHSKSGYYIPVSGKKIYGMLFTSSAPWDDTITDSNSTPVELSAADLESGLFLPKIGVRGSNNGAYTATEIKNCNAWAVYWAGTAGSSKDGAGQVQSPWHLNFGGTWKATSGHYWPIGGTGSTYACNNRVGAAIRPVYF